MKCNIPINDLTQRLHDSICRYNNIPVRIRVDPGSDVLQLYSLAGQKVGVTKSSDELLDISGIPLGYIQIGPDAVVYVRRKPARIYKQGVNNDSVSWSFMSRDSALKYKPTLFSKEAENMITGVYPSLEQAIKLLKIPNPNRPSTEIAISRDIAMRYDHEMSITYVYYKGMKVGYIIKDSNTVITPSNEMGWVISRFLSRFSWIVE